MDSRCPVCWSPVLDDLLICSGCNTRQHARCVASSGGCVVAGCSRPSAPVPTPAENLAEARATRLARLAEAAREARALRAARPAAATPLDAAPWAHDLPRPVTRPGNHLAGVIAVPPVASTAHADPSRGWLGRLLDSAFETLAILPRALPLMLFGMLLGFLPSLPYFLGLGHRAGWLTWLAGLALGLAAPLVVYPATTLLVLYPELRAAPWSTLLARTTATWRRYIPTMLALVILLAAPIFAMMPFIFVGGALPAALFWAFVYCAVQLAPVIACTADPAPLASAWTLARAHKLAMFGAAIATLVLPSAASLMLQYTAIRHGLFGWPYFVVSALAIELVTRVFPLAYLSLLYRDLTARA